MKSNAPSFMAETGLFDGAVGGCRITGMWNRCGLAEQYIEARCAGHFQIGDNHLIAFARIFLNAAEPSAASSTRKAVALGLA